ncbi:O-antigen ligase family protein [Marinobacter zhanjiangensis]|uniref:O-antigen ligase family protein n=1 Tax=Marinobacter zhanjiangensis TaxID=578215 RepID=UPI00167AC2E0|nr:O-antigen ligase family protein [Marinobacter zhanjiangensis]
MPITVTNGRWIQFRHSAALLVLVFIVAFVPLLTIRHNSVQANNYVALAQVLFFLFLIRETLRTIGKVVLNSRHIILSCFLGLAILIIVFSLFKVGGYDRAIYYISGFLFFFSLVYFFRNFNELYLVIAWLKIVSVLLVSMTFFIGLFWYREDFYSFVISDPPVYGNIRHFNYELMMAFGALYLLVVSKNVGFYIFSIFFLIFATFSVWTGGRAQLLSLLILMVLLVFSKCYREAAVGMLMLALAFVLVFLSGETMILLGQLDRTFDSAAIDQMSSGRLTLWYQTWSVGLEAGWLGHGADSFRSFDIVSNSIVQPHNSILQFFFEYGFLGLVLSVCFFIWTSLICLRVIFLSSGVRFLKCLVSFLLSMYAYGLLTGIFYHAIPLSYMIILGALCFSELNKQLFDEELSACRPVRDPGKSS